MWLYLPIIGVILFCLMYFWAAQLYPGGNEVDVNAIGYSWQHNYWCTLLGVDAKNGAPNKAFPVAMTAMVILCASLSLFFWQFPEYFALSNRWSAIVKYGGAIAMLVCLLLFSELHDPAIPVASFFGLFALIGVFIGIYTEAQWTMLYWGIFCLLVMGLNNYIYYTSHGIYYLPLIQKFSFVFVLAWVVYIQTYMIQQAA